MDFTMSTLTEIKLHTPTVDDMRSLAANNPRTSVLGKDFLVYPEVYHPDISLDVTEFMNKEILKEITKDLTKKAEEESFDFLEVGCGAGYTSILTALASKRCHVWATDVNETAVKNAIENAKLHGVDARVKVVISDVFNHKMFAGKKFDMIYWNIPWFGQHTEPGTDLEQLMRSLLDPGYQSFRRYLLEAKNYLKKGGRIFVTFSFTIGSKELFDRVVKETGWNYKISSRNNFLIEIADEQQEIDVSIVEFFE
ncbi:bifunctional methyltransferase-like isoform X2 [Oculina patagonica]